jgi:phosphoglycolate phosphatase
MQSELEKKKSTGRRGVLVLVNLIQRCKSSQHLRYPLVIFDFDGTLSDSFPWFLHDANKLAEELELPRFDPAELDHLRTLNAREILKRLKIPFWRLPFFLKRVHRAMAARVHEISLFPGVPAMLQRLRAAGIVVALVTSNSQANAQAILGPESSAAISHYHGGVAIFGKRQKFRQVLRATRFQARQAISIGDELRDLEAARAEGIPFGAVSWGYTRPEGFLAHQPDATFTDVASMSDWLCA